jgi:hypothetical protein
MAQRYTTKNGTTLIIPGTYVDQQVVSNQLGLGLSGVVTLIGEADEGPSWREESDIADSGFGPGQLSSVVAKYGSGKLVDAFRAVVGANADPAIAGSVTRVNLIKTNTGTKANLLLKSYGIKDYAKIQARRAGKPGNSISYFGDTKTKEVAPQIPNVGFYYDSTATVSIQLIANGSSTASYNIPAHPGSAPAHLAVGMASAFEAFAIVNGGTRRNILGSQAGTLSTAIASGNLIVTRSVAWDNNPQVNDIALIRTGSTLGAANVGMYRVLSATNTSVTLVPVTGATLNGTITNATEGTGGTVAIECYSPITITNATGKARSVWTGVTGTITPLALTSKSLKLTFANPLAVSPRLGDLVRISNNTIFGGGLAGWYEITAVSSVGTYSVTMKRLSDEDLPVSPTADTAANVSPHLTVYRPDIDGLGKSLELSSTAPEATSVIKSALSATNTSAAIPQLNALTVSAQERVALVTTTRPNALSPEKQEIAIGGAVVMAVGYDGTGTLSIANGVLTTSVSNTSDNLSVDLSQFPTIQSLVDYLNSRPNYTASIIDQKYRGTSSLDLCEVTQIGLRSSLGKAPARIKRDAKDFINKISESSMIAVKDDPTAGLPDKELALQFLANGAKGASRGADILEAIEDVELLPTNFVVTCFDQDQVNDVAENTAEDTANPADRYEIDAINAAVKTHVINMSSLKARKNRIAIVSKRVSTFAEAREAAANIGHPRVAFSWCQVNDFNSSGQIKLFPAWYTAAKAAGHSASAGYKGIVKKAINISGVKYPADFDPRRNDDLEQALEAGLLIIERIPTGGFRWVSDQTTYSIDSNFVYNSIQAVYVADLITLTLIQNSDRVIVGQSIADVSAGVIRGFIKSEMANFLRLKFIAPSDDGAPNGYRNLNVRIVGGVAEIDVEIKLAGLIYFVPIQLSLSQAEQTA